MPRGVCRARRNEVRRRVPQPRDHRAAGGRDPSRGHPAGAHHGGLRHAHHGHLPPRHPLAPAGHGGTALRPGLPGVRHPGRAHRRLCQCGAAARGDCGHLRRPDPGAGQRRLARRCPGRRRAGGDRLLAHGRAHARGPRAGTHSGVPGRGVRDHRADHCRHHPPGQAPGAGQFPRCAGEQDHAPGARGPARRPRAAGGRAALPGTCERHHRRRVLPAVGRALPSRLRRGRLRARGHPRRLAQPHSPGERGWGHC